MSVLRREDGVSIPARRSVRRVHEEYSGRKVRDGFCNQCGEEFAVRYE
ncbi:hypothetical protein [Halorussus ruber]|nr:hypothetical protein [Halorussus ruber]